jgi:hypothetical protein
MSRSAFVLPMWAQLSLYPCVSVRYSIVQNPSSASVFPNPMVFPPHFLYTFPNAFIFSGQTKFNLFHTNNLQYIQFYAEHFSMLYRTWAIASWNIFFTILAHTQFSLGFISRSICVLMNSTESTSGMEGCDNVYFQQALWEKVRSKGKLR